MKPYKKFTEWMHIHKKIREEYPGKRDWNEIIVMYLEWIFLFLIEWRFNQRIEDYNGIDWFTKKGWFRR